MNHYKRNAAYVVKNWPDIVRDAKKELADTRGHSIFGPLYRITGHDLNTVGNEEIMSIGENRLVVARDGKLVGTPKPKGKLVAEVAE